MSELALLRSVGAEGGPSDADVEEARSRAQRRLRVAIAREQVGPVRRAPPRPWLAWRPSLLVGAAAALVMVVAAAVALSALRPPAATARLDRLAVVAEGAQQSARTGDGFVYTSSDVAALVQQVAPGGDVITFVAHQRIERWRDLDGRLRVRTTFGAPTFLSVADEESFAAAGLDVYYGEGVVEDATFEPTQVLDIARSWSTDPDGLRSEMLGELEAAGDTDVAQPARLLELGAALLASPGAEADLRAAVLRVLAAEDGIESADAATASGEPGVAVMVEYDDDGITYERRLVFDTATAQLVEQRLVALDPLPGGLPAGTVLRHQVDDPSVRVSSFGSPPTTG